MDNNYRIYGATNGNPAVLVKEFYAKNLQVAQAILATEEANPSHLYTYLWLHTLDPVNATTTTTTTTTTNTDTTTAPYLPPDPPAGS